jgi:hypothetical protein
MKRHITRYSREQLEQAIELVTNDKHTANICHCAECDSYRAILEKENNDMREYIGTYKVYKVFRKSNRREVIRRGLTRNEAMQLVNSYPDSSRSMVVFDKQFYADKYFVEAK